jgi:hypothetical protein
MAQGIFRLTDATFNGTNANVFVPAPQAILDCWNVPPKPTEDDEGNPLPTPTPYTFREAHDAASLGSAPYFPIVHEDGEIPLRQEEGVTHWIIPVNNVDMHVFDVAIQLAEQTGTPRCHIYMPINCARTYFNTGELQD